MVRVLGEMSAMRGAGSERALRNLVLSQAVAAAPDVCSLSSLRPTECAGLHGNEDIGGDGDSSSLDTGGMNERFGRSGCVGDSITNNETGGANRQQHDTDTVDFCDPRCDGEEDLPPRTATPMTTGRRCGGSCCASSKTS